MTRQRRRTGRVLAALVALGLPLAAVGPVLAQSADQLVEQAREAARADRNRDAADLFRRALEADGAVRARILREYADQLAFSNRAAEAVPLFREVLAGQPSPEERGRAERGLALALLWSGQSEEAVAAWEAIVSASRDDADARKNLREALVGAARASAGRNQNARSAAFFERAIALAPERRPEILNEYAEQLTYSDRAAQAVPLLRELLAASPGGERARDIQRDLALALLWSGRADEAVEAWRRVQSGAPNDPDARKNLREALVASARQAARRDQNARAANLLASAIALQPERRREILKEYADQLTYSDRAAQAVPLYRELLPGERRADERRSIERGLALALLRSGRGDEAVAAWERVLAAAPGDADARGNLREALIVSARDLASRDQNARSAEAFARAIALVPQRRTDLLREYADQLTFSNRAAQAVPLYDEALASGTLSRDDTRRARRGRALALLRSGDFARAVAAWEPIFRADRRDGDARKNLTDAVVGAARAAASRDRNAQAADLFERAIALSPGRRLELAVEYANQLTYSDRAALAVPIYREALASGTLRGDGRRPALLGLALALSWSNQLPAALEAYDQALQEFPNAVEAWSGRGRVLSWLDRNREALASYEGALALEPGNREAVRGAAQVESYLGLHRRALARIAPLLGPNADRETLLIAARAEMWKGRPDLARALAQRAAAARSGDADARRILDEIARNQRPELSIQGSVSTQNNGLVIAGSTIRQSFGFNDGLTTLGLQHRLLNFDPRSAPDVRLHGAGVFGRHRFNDALELNSSIYLNRLTSRGFSYLEPTHDTYLTIYPNDYLRFDISASRSFFDDVRSLSRNIRMDAFGASVDLRPDQDLRLTARGSYGRISDGNSRFFGQLEAERRIVAKPDIFLGARYTTFDFARPQLDNGYFNPDWLHSVEATLRLQTQIAPGWDVSAMGSYGREWQPDAEKPIWTASVGTSYAATDRLTFNAEVRHQNSSSVGGSSGFRRTTFTGGLRLRW